MKVKVEKFFCTKNFAETIKILLSYQYFKSAKVFGVLSEETIFSDIIQEANSINFLLMFSLLRRPIAISFLIENSIKLLH